jgi:glycosyltransferase involved in cell wall biosynthesis
VLAVGGRIEFCGERKDVDRILPTFSVFILPSLVEGMSMALLEAMAAGRAIVATRVGGNIDLIQDGENGLLVSPGEPEEMAHAALRLLRNPQWAGQLGRAARIAVMNQHGADKMVEDLKGIYERLLAGGGSSSTGGMLGPRGML